jgi:hypothetical protein
MALETGSISDRRNSNRRFIFLFMVKNITIVSVELEGEDGLIVTFSDATTGAYVVDELLELRPHREPCRKSVDNRPRTTPRPS